MHRSSKLHARSCFSTLYANRLIIPRMNIREGSLILVGNVMRLTLNQEPCYFNIAISNMIELHSMYPSLKKKCSQLFLLIVLLKYIVI